MAVVSAIAITADVMNCGTVERTLVLSALEMLGIKLLKFKFAELLSNFL